MKSFLLDLSKPAIIETTVDNDFTHTLSVYSLSAPLIEPRCFPSHSKS